MDRALLDTDILKGRRRCQSHPVSLRLRSLHYLGHHRPRGRQRFPQAPTRRPGPAISGRLPGVELLTLDQRSAALAGRIYANLERVGQPIGRAGPMIAAIALGHGLTLVTGNLSHYLRIQALGYGINLNNWRA